MALHLENQKTITFKDTPMTPEQLLEIAERNKGSMLTKFFELCAREPSARQFTYDNILMHWRWDENKKKFFKRTRNLNIGIVETNENQAMSAQIGRIPMVTLNPYTKELYFLRTLLLNIPGPKSFEDLRTVDGKVYNTNQEACVALGLYEDDKSIEQSFEEGAAFKVSELAVMQLFVTLCVHVMPTDPLTFWEKYKNELCSWRTRSQKLDEPTPEIINDVLLLLRDMFEQHGKNMSVDFNLPEPTGQLSVERREVANELAYNTDDMKAVVAKNESTMNEDQLLFWTALREGIDNNSGDVYALQASGMSFPTKTIIVAYFSIDPILSFQTFSIELSFN